MNRDRPVGSVAAMVTVKQSRFQNVTNLIPNKVYEISKLRFMTGIIDFRAQHQRSIIHSHLVVGAEICRAAECNATACCYAAMVQANQTKNHIFPIPMRDVMVKLPSTGWDGMKSPHTVAVLRDVNHIYGHTVLAGVFPSHPPRFRGWTKPSTALIPIYPWRTQRGCVMFSFGGVGCCCGKVEDETRAEKCSNSKCVAIFHIFHY